MMRTAGLYTLLLGLLATLVGCSAVGSRDVTVWVVDADEPLTVDTPPLRENVIYSAARGEVRLSAALNETVAFQVALRGNVLPAGPFEVHVSDLVAPTEVLPAAAAVSLYRVHYTTISEFRSWYPEYTGRPATPTLFPDILVPWDAPRGGGPLLIDQPRNEIVWVDIRVPITLSPGEYRGRLEVRAAGDGQPVFACNIRLDVLSVALPGRHSLPILCRVDPRSLLVAQLQWPAESAADTRLLPDAPGDAPAIRLLNNTMQLFHEHRLVPMLWGSFPKLRPVGDRGVEVDWEPYDRLVSGWLDGSAFADRARLEYWPIPATLDYPDAERAGGLGSPRYARLLAAYLAECRRHFAERGWLDRTFLRLVPPLPLAQTTVDTLRTLSGVVRASETELPLVAHLPGRSLAGLGWHDAPTIDVEGVATWAPPAMWYEPDVMEQQRKLGHRTWLMPDHPPYSGSLAVEAAPTDARVLAWQAFRYGAEALWIENAADLADQLPLPDASRPWRAAGLLYSGTPYGLKDRPVPSVRLKRLRRGQEDYELLRLLEVNGKGLLAESVAEQIVRWACTGACLDNLLSCKPAGWPRDPLVLRRARELVLNELAHTFTPESLPPQQQIALAVRWAQTLNQPESVAVAVDGVRLTRTQVGLRAHVRADIVNTSRQIVDGQWSLPAPSATWRQVRPVFSSVPPGTLHTTRIQLDLGGLAYNTDGVYPFELSFDSPTLGRLPVQARLAVAACRLVRQPPAINGVLDDWPLASDNAAGDFRLCRSPMTPRTELAPVPTLPTHAYFTLDQDNLYVAIRCSLRPNEPPVWQADNTIPLDGDMPWGQDVVEILLDPRDETDGSGRDLYCLQIKPSGLLIGRRGCRTEPPMGPSQLWQSGARAAVRIEPDTWVVEVAIPLSAFGPEARSNAVWGFNITRLDARRGEYSSWSGARGYCYTPQSLGNLIMLWP